MKIFWMKNQRRTRVVLVGSFSGWTFILVWRSFVPVGISIRHPK
jgi:hypothetical protein